MVFNRFFIDSKCTKINAQKMACKKWPPELPYNKSPNQIEFHWFNASDPKWNTRLFTSTKIFDSSKKKYYACNRNVLFSVYDNRKIFLFFGEISSSFVLTLFDNQPIQHIFVNLILEKYINLDLARLVEYLDFWFCIF